MSTTFSTGFSVSQELPYAVNLTVGYTGSRGKDMFLRGVANTFNDATRVRPDTQVGQVDYKTSGCVDGLVLAGREVRGCGYAEYNAFQLGVTRRFQAGFTGGMQSSPHATRGRRRGRTRR